MCLWSWLAWVASVLSHLNHRCNGVICLRCGYSPGWHDLPPICPTGVMVWSVCPDWLSLPWHSSHLSHLCNDVICSICASSPGWLELSWVALVLQGCDCAANWLILANSDPNFVISEISVNLHGGYSTVSTRQLLFVWCSLSDDHQTIVRCLSDVPPDICQLPSDICQTSTTYTPDMYHQTICPPDIYCTICTPDIHQTYTRHPPHICQMYGKCLVYKSYLSDRCLVRHLTGIWQSSDNHLTGSTRQIATVWWKRWCRGLYYSETAMQMPQLQEVSAHFSQFRTGPVSSLGMHPICPIGIMVWSAKDVPIGPGWLGLPRYYPI